MCTRLVDVAIVTPHTSHSVRSMSPHSADAPTGMVAVHVPPAADVDGAATDSVPADSDVTFTSSTPGGYNVGTKSSAEPSDHSTRTKTRPLTPSASSSCAITTDVLQVSRDTDGASSDDHLTAVTTRLTSRVTDTRSSLTCSEATCTPDDTPRSSTSTEPTETPLTVLPTTDATPDALSSNDANDVASKPSTRALALVH